jgi:LPXTG-motif cell wall-anchored protein
MHRWRELAALGELQRKVWGEAVQRQYRAARRRLRTRRLGFATIAFGVTLVVLGIASPGAHATPPRPLHKITLCHRTDSYTNPYVVITVDVASVRFEGHDGHDGPVFFPAIPKHVKWGDIIPPFDFGGRSHYAGKNWTAEGIAVFNNRCALPGSAPPTTTTVPTGTTVSPTTKPSPGTTIAPPSSTSSPAPSTTLPSASTSSTVSSSSTTVPGATSTVPSSVTTAGGRVTTTVTSGEVTTTSPPIGISTFQVPTTTSTSPGGPLPRTGAGAIALVLTGIVCVGAGLGLTRRRPIA